MRLNVRRTPRPSGKPARFGEHLDWEYGAFVTNTPGRPGPSMPVTAPKPTSRTG